jgi:hypothetical protein
MTSLLGRSLDRVRRLSPDSVWEMARVHGQIRNERELLAFARAGRDVCWPDERDEPLVTVRIATYNRGDLILERALASAVRQTYPHLEILVVGDACDEATSDAVRRCTDPRVRFVNLAQRGLYPPDPSKRWAVAGSQPMNAALFLAAGDWIAPCDDDDELVDDHVEVLLRHARERRLEMVYSQAACEQPDGTWGVVGSEPLRWGGATHGSILWSAGLRFMLHSMSSWKLGWPGDWELMRRMDKVGVRIGFLPQVTYRHYAEARHRTSGP